MVWLLDRGERGECGERAKLDSFSRSLYNAKRFLKAALTSWTLQQELKKAGGGTSADFDDFARLGPEQSQQPTEGWLMRNFSPRLYWECDGRARAPQSRLREEASRAEDGCDFTLNPIFSPQVPRD